MDLAQREQLEALFARGKALLLSQEAELAEACAREILAAVPDAVRAHVLLADALIMQGRLKEGFAENEHRRHRHTTSARQLPFPEWMGEPLDGRSILVWGEQGIGDEIQMVRFGRKLRDRGARLVALACHPLSVRAYPDHFDLIVPRPGPGQQTRVPNQDLWVLTGSLPARLGVSLETLDGAPYLRAPAKGAGGIGLVEKGNPQNERDQWRSLPEGLLQRAVPQGRLLQPDGDIFESLGQVAALDLLITVDTSWAHMAGALGVPCWTLLPHHNLDPRWMRGRSDTPWYSSMRLFRQPPSSGWEVVAADVVAALGVS